MFIKDASNPEPVKRDHPLDALTSATRADLGRWIESFERSGMHATRKGSPDLLAQLRQSSRRPIDTVLCTAVDNDPRDLVQSTVAMIYPREIAAAIVLLAGITGATRSMIVTGPGLEPLNSQARAVGARAVLCPPDYPRTNPTILLRRMIDRRLAPGRLPSETGVVLLDAVAAMQIGRVALLDEPVRACPIWVFDHRHGSGFVRFAPRQWTVEQFLQSSSVSPAARMRQGSLLAQIPLSNDARVDKIEPVIHVLAEEPTPLTVACVRCAWCVEACPTRVQPAMALEAAQRNDEDLADRAGVHACIECGLCTFVCPSGLPLLEAVRALKGVAGRALIIDSGS